jgi:hypothetical protein
VGITRVEALLMEMQEMIERLLAGQAKAEAN